MCLVLDRVAAVTSRYNMFTPGDRVGVAVSGGADSVCLLRVLQQFKDKFGIKLHVIHINHQLRGDESEADSTFVEDLARQHELPFHRHRCDTSALALGENLEQTARNIRREYFAQLRSAGAVTKIATGHSQSDQAETVLFRLLRGSGPSGLAGILPVTNEGLVRPLIESSREEIRQYLRSIGQPWREDSSNRLLDFSRNRIRQQVIPALIQDHNPNLETQLAQTAMLAQEDEQFWQSYMDALAERHIAFRKGGAVLPCRVLQDLPLAVSRRLVRRAMLLVKGDLRQIEFGHVELALGLAAQAGGGGRAQAPGLDLFRSFDWLRIAPALQAQISRNTDMKLVVPGENRLPYLGLRTSLEGAAAQCGYNKEQVDAVSCNHLDWEKVKEPLMLRYWLPGDAYQPQCALEPVKLKQMFQAARVPLWERRFWPIIESSQGILWSRGFGSQAGFLPANTTRQVLRIEEIPCLEESDCPFLASK